MKDRGYTVLLDSVIALLFVSVIFVSLLGFQYSATSRTSITSFKNLHYLSEDVLETMNKQGILDEIGEAWAENDMNRSMGIADYYLSELVPANAGYRLTIDDEVVSNGSGRRSMGDATELTHSSRVLVGYGKGLPVKGSVARAFLTGVKSKETASYAYFGGFVGEGNITRIVEGIPLDANISEIYLELSVGEDFKVFINGIQCGGLKTKASNTYNVGTYILDTVCHDDITPGENNTFEIIFDTTDLSVSYIGGGFIRVSYTTKEFAAQDPAGIMRYNFPGIVGLINLYDSFYVPGDLYQMDMYLHIKNNYTTFMRVGDSQVNLSTNGTEQIILMDDVNFSSFIDYGASDDEYSEQTVPLRLGTEGLSYFMEGGDGIADIMLITDNSGSMGEKFDGDYTGAVDRVCTDPNLFDLDTTKISVAKCNDKDFVNIVTNVSGNRIGLVAYGTSVCRTQSLTDNTAALIANIDFYDDDCGYTCTSCSIRSARETLANLGFEKLVERESCWKYSTDYLASAPPAGWNNLSFDDSTWDQGKAILGFGNTSELMSTNVHTTYLDIWNTAGGCSKNVDFTDGVNSLDNTFSNGGDSNDGWDWWRDFVGDATSDHCEHGDPSGKSDYDTDTSTQIQRYDGPGSRKYIAVVVGPSGNNLDDISDSGAWGIEFNITDAMWVQINAGATTNLSFWWGADDADDDLEEGAWIKARFSDTTDTYWLGSDLDSGHRYSDASNEIWGSVDDDSNGWNSLVSGNFWQNVSPYISGPGAYYLALGAKVDFRGPWSNGRSNREGLAAYFDNIQLKVGEGAGALDADLWDMAQDIPSPVDFTSGLNSTANTEIIMSIDFANYDDGWDWFRGDDAYGTLGPGGIPGNSDMTSHYDPSGLSGGTTQDGSSRLEVRIEGRTDEVADSGAWGVQINITQAVVDAIAAGAEVFVSFDYEAFDTSSSDDTEESVWIKSRFFQLGDPDLSNNYLGYDLDTGNGNGDAPTDTTLEVLYDHSITDNIEWDEDEVYGDFDMDGNGINNSGRFRQNVSTIISSGGAGWYYLDFGVKFDATTGSQSDSEGIIAYFTNVSLELIPTIAASGDYHFRKTFTVNKSTLNITKLFVLSDDKAEVYLNGVLIDNDSTEHSGSYWDRDGIVINNNDVADGDNVLGVIVHNDDTSSAAFDLEIINTIDRLKAIIIMSDGCANRCIPGVSCSDATAKQEVLDEATIAYDTYGIALYTVLYGDASTCADNMNDTACIDNCSHFYMSTNASELATIYREIAQDLVNASYRGQAINVTEGDIFRGILYNDSYIEFTYDPSINPPDYGEISINLDTPTFGGCEGKLSVRDNLTVVDVKITSYSGEYWTDYLSLNNSAGSYDIYTLRDSHFGGDYTILGDPYFIQVPASLIKNGENNSFTIGTGNDPSTPTFCSEYSRAIYTVRLRGSVDYGGVFQDKEGCTWNIEFEDGSDTRIDFPSNYNGTNECNYTSICSTSACYDTNDAVDDAVYRLLSQLDIDDDGMLGLEFAAGQLIVDFSKTGEVRSLWGPIQADLTIWR
ncbi:MAG: VWA domain-containing protein [Candidatus Altiarchaeota archaeon]